MAINIQRGRDRGIPGYNSFRKLCNLPAFKNFHQFKKAIPRRIVRVLKKLYHHPDDVDLWVGGISEKPKAGHTLGPTFSCIIARQFEALRLGDRFWYETGDCTTGFTGKQLSEIRKVTLAGVICNNSDSIRHIARDVLDASTPRVSCKDIKQMDLRKWSTGVSFVL